MPSQKKLDALFMHEPGELGFFEAVKLIQDRIQYAGEADETGRALLEQGDTAQARARFEEGVELTEFSLGREANMWRVVLRDRQKTAPIYAEPSVTSRCLGSRNPDDRVNVALSKGDWVQLHGDEGWGEEPAWMIINRSGAAKGLGVMLEPEVSAQMRTRARELYLSLRLSASRACLAMGDGTNAALHATAALLFDEESQEAVLLRAVANISLDSETRIEEARDDLERLLQQQPDNQELREHLQRAKERLGEHQQEVEVQKVADEKQREEEEARERDLREVQEMRQAFRERAEEKRRIQEEEEARERARRQEEAEAQAAAGLPALTSGDAEAEAPGRRRGALCLMAQVSRLASSLPRPAPAIQDGPLEDAVVQDVGEAVGAGGDSAAASSAGSALATLGTGRGMGLRSRMIGARGPGLLGRGRGQAMPAERMEAPAEDDGGEPSEPGEASGAYPSSSRALAGRGAPQRIVEADAEGTADKGVWRRVLARPKKEAAVEGSDEVVALRKELRKLHRQKVRAIDEEDFKRAKELKQRHTEVAAQLKTAELKAKDQAASRLANITEDVRHLEAQVREAAEAGHLDLAFELRQRRDKVKAEMRKMQWVQQG